MKCEQAQDLITALVDNELNGEDRAGVESHLRECPACDVAHSIEVALKNNTRTAASTVRAPVGLAQNLSTLLTYATKQPTRQTSGRWWSAAPWWFAFAAVVAAMFVVPFRYLSREPESSLPPLLFKIHNEAVSGRITPVDAKSDGDLVRRLTEAVDGKFSPMGYDLSNINLKPASGAVGEINGRKALVVVYRGDAPELTCVTFPGLEQDAPREADLFFDPEKKINFHMFSHAGLNAVLHREGGIICVLISKLPMEDLLEVARSRAHHA